MLNVETFDFDIQSVSQLLMCIFVNMCKYWIYKQTFCKQDDTNDTIGEKAQRPVDKVKEQPKLLTNTDTQVYINT